MSKSTRLSKSDLEAMGLEEGPDGVYRPKNNSKSQTWLEKELEKSEKIHQDQLANFVASIDPVSTNKEDIVVYKSGVIPTDTHEHTGTTKQKTDNLFLSNPFNLSKYFKYDKIITITVLGEPTPQQRHRHHQVKGTGFVTTYDPSAKDKKEFLKQCVPYKPDNPYEQPLRVDMIFYFSRPKSHYRAGKYAHLLKDIAPILHVTRPDSDNCAKFVKDALNKTFWKDDSLVCDMTVKKRYSDNPRTEITIIPL